MDNIFRALFTFKGEFLTKLQLRSSYEIKDLRRCRFTRTSQVVILHSQYTHCECILECFSMSKCKPLSILLSMEITLISDNSSTTLLR